MCFERHQNHYYHAIFSKQHLVNFYYNRFYVKQRGTGLIESLFSVMIFIKMPGNPKLGWLILTKSFIRDFERHLNMDEHKRKFLAEYGMWSLCQMNRSIYPESNQSYREEGTHFPPPPESHKHTTRVSWGFHQQEISQLFKRQATQMFDEV